MAFVNEAKDSYASKAPEILGLGLVDSPKIRSVQYVI